MTILPLTECLYYFQVLSISSDRIIQKIDLLGNERPGTDDAASDIEYWLKHPALRRAAYLPEQQLKADLRQQRYVMPFLLPESLSDFPIFIITQARIFFKVGVLDGKSSIAPRVKSSVDRSTRYPVVHRGLHLWE